jgi:chorismate synthase
MVALTMAGVAHEKFGGDTALEMKRNFEGYIEQIRRY